MLTHVAREVRRQRPGVAVVVETNWPELFRNNPNVAVAVSNKVAPRYVRPSYRIEERTREHVLDQLIKSVGLPPRGERRVEVFLSREEILRATAELPRRYSVVCPVGKRTVAGNRKDWGVDRFQQVVLAAEGKRFVQVGSAADPLLEGVIDRRGLPVRESAAVLAGAETALLLEGGLMHLAAAVNTRAVVIYGGAVAPEVSAYPDHLNIVVRAPCGPCFRSHGRLPDCQRRGCMDRISPDLVLDLLMGRGAPPASPWIEVPW